MSMPNEFVLVRHGESEANVIQKADKSGEPHERAHDIHRRPDWQQRLSSVGIEQAQMAKEWIDRNLGGAATFDIRYVSSFLRTRETAAYVGGADCGEWIVDDRLIERDWGHYGRVSSEERADKFAMTKEMYEVSPWYTRLDGGQSRSDVSIPYRDFQGTLHREAAGKRVLAVTHGDFIVAARYNVERMLPEQFEEVERDSFQTIRNCTIIEYSRRNPEDSDDIRDKVSWRRITNPVDESRSPFDGEWVKLNARPKFTGADLLSQVEHAPRLLDEM